MTEPRVRPGGLRDVGFVGWTIARVVGRAGGSTPPNLFLTLGRHRRLFRGWLRFAGRLMPGGKLPRRETELVILRVAHLRSCRYEFDHHVHIARRAGIGPAEVERVMHGPGADGWSARERAMLTAVDMLHASDDVDDETWTLLRAHMGEREAIELVMLAAHYEMLATFIKTLRIQPDRRVRSSTTRRDES